jgi:CRISPR-associated protein Cas2
VTVFIFEQVKAGLRGELRKWMLELRTGVFVGSVSARVREILWKKIVERVQEDQQTELHYLGAWMVRDAPNEQGFLMETIGETKRELANFDGLWLIAQRK